MNRDPEDKRKRRRTCVDQMRRDLARRQERRSDPAGRMVLQLLALLSAALAMAPAWTEIISGSRRDRWQPPRGYTLGPNAWARERGLEPEPGETPTTPTPRLRPMPRPLPDCSWSRLVKDLRRRPTRDRAQMLIEQRVPEAARGWLRATIEAEDWPTLRTLGRDADADLIRERALAMAKVARVAVLEPTPDVEADAAPSM